MNRETGWSLRPTPAFERELGRLDRGTQRRVIKELEAVLTSGDPRSQGKSLRGGLQGYWRYRVGDYRVIVEIKDRELCLVAIKVGHRSRIYR
ncbi:MAG: type II toxin-antitoxin system RelE/ParE family toxin [Propionibacteriaceae bacterium]|nr:type II toxin-antitoxin system RelE/ParE family toxin [Propionibacteriaceae bacterium]